MQSILDRTPDAQARFHTARARIGGLRDFAPNITDNEVARVNQMLESAYEMDATCELYEKCVNAVFKKFVPDDVFV